VGTNIAFRESIGDPINAVNEKFNALAEIVGVSLGVEGLKTFIESMAELGEKTETSMTQLGISAESVTRLSGVARVSGTDFGALEAAIERLSLRVQEAAKDSFSPAAQGLKVLGINARELVGLPADQYFERLSEAVGKFNPSLNLTNAVMAVGGRNVVTLLPLLLQGKEHYEELASAVEKTGSVLSGFQSAAFAQTKEKIELLSLSVEGLGIKIFDTFRPAINSAIDGMTRLLQSIGAGQVQSAAISVGTSLITIGAQVASFFVGVDETVRKVIAVMTEDAKPKFGAFADFAIGSLGITFDIFRLGLNKMAESIVGVTPALNVQGEAIKKIGEAADQYRKSIEAAAESSRDFIKQALAPGAMDEAVAEFNRLHDAIKKVDAAGLDSAGHERLEAQLAASQTYIKQLDVEYAQTVEHLTAQVRTFQITEAQKTQAVQDALDDRLQDTMDELRRELAFYGLTAAQIQKIYDQMALVNTDTVAKGLKNTDQAFEAAAKQWEKAFAPLQQAWDSQLRGLLAGTTSWAQASKNIAADLILKLIELNETRVLHWVAGELAQTTATTTGVAARTAAEQSGSAISIAAQITKAVQAIGADAAKVYADVFAYLSPALGPFAAAPAAAASVTVLAAKALIPRPRLAATSTPRASPSCIRASRSCRRKSPNPTTGPRQAAATTSISVLASRRSTLPRCSPSSTRSCPSSYGA
jgi:hypothetical protein